MNGKLIVAISFPCALNDFAKNFCAGIEDAGSELPDGYSVEIKNGVEFGDAVAYTNLIKTSLQLEPAAMTVFPLGPTAVTAPINEICAAGVAVVMVDNAAEGVTCDPPFIGSDPAVIGANAAGWMADNVPAGTKVGMVTAPPDQSVGAARAAGFEAEAIARGLEIVQTVNTTGDLADSRKVTADMLTANPEMTAVFATDGIISPGVVQAIEASGRDITFVQIDAFAEVVPLVLDGTIAAMVGQDSYQYGYQSVKAMQALVQGETVAPATIIPGSIIDITNAQEFLDTGRVS